MTRAALTRGGTLPLLILSALLLCGAAATPPEPPAGRLAEPAARLAVQVLSTYGLTTPDREPIWVRVYDVYSSEGAEGIGLVAELSPDQASDEPPIRIEAATGPGGLARLDFDRLPVGVDRFELSVEAHIDGSVRRVETQGSLRGPPLAVCSTDKRLYKRGQTLRARGLFRDRDLAPLAGAEVVFQLLEDWRTTVLRAARTTSAAGIAAVEMELPEELGDGTYYLHCSLAGDEIGYRLAVEIGDYELPRFSVSAATERPYHLRGEVAALEISAATLAGAPLADAEVEVVIAGRRTQGAQGTVIANARTDAAGRARVELRLGEGAPAGREHDCSYRRFVDHELRVEVTDPLSRRVETATVRVRESGQPIHVYARRVGPRSGHPPGTLFVTTYYADGEPAACRVEVTREDTGELEGSLETSSLGVGKLVLDGGVERLRLEAVDASGRRGEHSMSSWADADLDLWIDSERSILEPGEPLRLRLHPRRPLRDVLVQLRAGDRHVASRYLPRLDGVTALSFPHPPGVSGRVTATALPLREKHRYHWAQAASRSVVYTGDRALRLELRADRESYRPGDTATLSLESRRGGEPVAASLGLVGVDSALRLRETVSSPREAGHSPFLWPAESADRWTPHLSGWDLRRLARLEPGAQVPPELALLAEALLSYTDVDVQVRETSPLDALREEAKRFAGEQLAPYVEALRAALSPGSLRLLPASREGLDELLTKAGPPLDSLADRWGTPYRLSVQARAGWLPARETVSMRLCSAGYDRLWNSVDDILIWHDRWSRFDGFDRLLRQELERQLAERLVYPNSTADFEALLDGLGVRHPGLEDGGVPLATELALLDDKLRIRLIGAGGDGVFVPRPGPWADDVVVWQASLRLGDALRAAVAEELERSLGRRWHRRAGRKVAVAARRALDSRAARDPFGNPWLVRVESGPQAQVRILSAGADGADGSDDDLLVARLSPARLEAGREAIQGDRRLGAIVGRVTDEGGSPLPGVAVELSLGGRESVAVTDAGGGFEFRHLQPDSYGLKASLTGFSTVEYPAVEVRAGRVTSIQIELSSAIEEVITVTSKAPQLETRQPSRLEPEPPPLATPRVRSDFREVVLWLPELSTDAEGRAEVEVDLADSLTAWQIEAIASTAEGELAVGCHRLRVSQPVHVDSDPPHALTVGDRVRMPLYFYNLTADDVSLAAEARAGGGLAVDGAGGLAADGLGDLPAAGGGPGELALPRGASARRELAVRATAAGDGWLEVSAAGAGEGDASRRSLPIVPDARLQEVVASRLLGGSGEFEIVVPRRIVGDAELEIRIHGDLAAQLVDATEALVRRPTGCAEQRISLAYPSLMLLRLLAESGERRPALEARARGYVSDVMLALPRYQAASGAFDYWIGGRGNVALTAYALEFLVDAAAAGEAPGAALDAAAAFLIGRLEDAEGSAPLTDAQAATALAALARHVASVEPLGGGLRARVEDAVEAAAERLKRGGDVFALAALTLAATELERDQLARRLARRLVALGTRRDGVVFWDAAARSPYLSRGRARREEATARAVAALGALPRKADPGDGLAPESARLRSRGHPRHRGERFEEALEGGIIYLATARRPDGVWSTTHSTVRALQALAGHPVALDGGPLEGAPRLDGRALGEPLADRPESTPAWRVDGLTPGRHLVTLPAAGGGRRLPVQVVVRYHTRWPAKPIREGARGWDFKLRCPRGPYELPGPIDCEVEIDLPPETARSMLVAEIGLPPGTRVDRAALDRQLDRPLPPISSYELRPDRLVTYLWSRKQIRFSLRLSPRLAMSAKSVPSRLWDYYDPDSSVTLPPREFVVLSSNRQSPEESSRVAN